MNFLEQLAAEWYEYNGYLRRTNIKFGKRVRGGWKGEIDIAAYNPDTKEFIHIETSTDADGWTQRKKRFEKKFTDAREHYMEIFSFKHMDIKPRQIAIAGLNRTPSAEVASWKSSAPNGLPWGDIKIEVIHIPEFIKTINAGLKDKNPERDAVPESYPLLRAIQYSIFYNKI